MHPNDDTLEVTISVEESLQELLVAELAERGFDSFEQTEHTLKAYSSPSIWSDDLSLFLRDWLKANHSSPDYDVVMVPSQNWNEQWEASIQSIDVGLFRIKPSWISDDGTDDHGDDRVIIQIDPQMSFGTGYHASTRLALRLLPESLKSGDFVLDAGTGTGILSIAAAKLGARSVYAFDNDPWAYQNAVVNVRTNNVSQAVTVGLGDIDSVPKATFDLVLANIHLTVIEAMMPAFRSRLASMGRIVVSGLLQVDEARIRSLADRSGLSVVREVSEDEWYAATLKSEES